MLYTIRNEYLTVKIADKGAQLWSIMDKDCNEYLWQGDAKYWKDRAINLFPYIARLTEGQYRLRGNIYKMDIHGFAKDVVFKAEQIAENHIVFSIEDTEEAYKQYPYRFTFCVIYKLIENRVSVTYLVKNKDEETMYFGVGGHPGFNVPFEKDTVFEDYYLEFDSAEKTKRVRFSEDCFVLGLDDEFELQEDKCLPLRHDMFDDDAIVLTDMAKGVTLKSKKGNKAIRVTYPNMSYIGFWHKPKTDAPYICIEPWSSLPSRKGIVEELETQPGLVSLETEKEYKTQFLIEIIE